MEKLLLLGQQAHYLLQNKSVGWAFAVLLLSNVFNYHMFGSRTTEYETYNKQSLFLMDEAARYVPNVQAFEQKVRDVSHRLQIPPEWLMSVIYSESKFNAKAKNHKGSGAVGLIQWMPATARDYGVSTSQLLKMDHLQQLDFVYEYLNRVRLKYGSFDSITELYLAILYPRAVGEGTCYTLYAKPSVAYRQNAGLDANKDGAVTVKDIDNFLMARYKPAFEKTKESL